MAPKNDSLWEMIISFMEDHSDFARGHINGPNGRERYSALWKELAQLLSAAGFGMKEPSKWQKVSILQLLNLSL